MNDTEYRTEDTEVASLEDMTERRSFELRAEEKDGRMELYGTPIAFEKPAMVTALDSRGRVKRFIEIIDSHALDKTDMRDTALKHAHGGILARVRNKSLQLMKMEDRLDMHAYLSDTQKCRDAYTEVRDGLCPDMSFAFPSEERGTVAEWSKSPDGTPIRRITHIPKLIDVSTAYDGVYGDYTHISARSFDLMDIRLKALDSADEQPDGDADLDIRKRRLKLLTEVLT